MDALVSVIIPVYKVEAFLDRCVESVVGQTYPKLEIILVDDGSPDTCPEKCDAWAKKDSRIQVIHKKKRRPWLCPQLRNRCCDRGVYHVRGFR